ncbi:centromere protein L-like [Diadema setosum]|uniref:centromere protein L-like n=1 Tax=Diadema setosum TaxID=31175 RepID=UPI003B3A6051
MASRETPPTRVQVITPSQSLGQTERRSKSRSIARRLHAPYTKTPGSRKIHGLRSRLSRTPNDSRSSIQSLHRLVNKTWHAHHVTPLSRFSTDATALRRFARHLSSHLQAESQKGVGVMMEDNIISKYAVFTTLPTSVTDSEHPSVELSIFGSKSQAAAAGSSPSWTAILFPSTSIQTSKDSANFFSLPLMLVKGAVRTTQCVLHWMEMQFDCCIKKLTFNPMYLSWMVSMWAGSLPDPKKSGEDKKCAVELVYSMPKGITGLNKVTMTIDAKDAKALWESVHDNTSDDAKEEEVTAFMKALEDHFHACFKVHLSALHLKTIGTAAAYVGAEGRVKMLSVREAGGVLQHLLELAEEQNTDIL